MPVEYTSESLKEAIKTLEIKQVENEKELRLQLLNVYENLKPINILKNIARDVVTTDSLKNDITNTMTSVISGFITKKIIVGKSKNPFLKLIGVAIQFGMTTLVSKNYDIIKNYIANFINLIQEKAEEKEEEDPPQS
ncbi:MAG TPA: hypothetical protein PLC80_15695 [Draconibacterium sp.]|nr:hypothetical protein [Draconibacterium sp.]